MKLCIIVGNSLRKDPRVIKQIKCAIDEGIDVHFIGFIDENFRKEFFESVGCPISIVDVGEKYRGHLKSLINFYHLLQAEIIWITSASVRTPVPR